MRLSFDKASYYSKHKQNERESETSRKVQIGAQRVDTSSVTNLHFRVQYTARVKMLCTAHNSQTKLDNNIALLMVFRNSLHTVRVFPWYTKYYTSGSLYWA